MEMKYWSGYAKYLVLADKAGVKLRGDYLSYQDFNLVTSIIERLAKSDNNTYSYDNNIYKRKITSAEAKSILTNIEDCKWRLVNNKMLLVANQVGLTI
jgi:hypothetical protein